jgi:uncharacterized protein YeaO (DUF488 family)
MITVRRVYDKEEAGERYTILVDRLWPRGISKTDAGWNEWLKELSPSNGLRKWYNHDPSKWDEFKRLYKEELTHRQEDLKRLRQLEMKHGTLTFLYSSKERERNNAVALREFLMHPDS